MKLINDWKLIIKQAWSIRLMLLAGLLSGVEVALPLFVDNIPRNLFAVLSLITIAAAFVSRLLAQKGLPNDQ